MKWLYPCILFSGVTDQYKMAVYKLPVEEALNHSFIDIRLTMRPKEDTLP